jgi:protein SCO1/2
MLRILVIALVLLVAVMFWLPRPGRLAPTEVATVLPNTLALPELALVDQAGREFDLTDLRGGFRLMFFGFTNCPDICPLTLQVLADARAEIEKRDAKLTPKVVFVSVDPNRDSPQRIASYLSNFDPEFTGVTGSEPALAPLLKVLGVTVEKHAHAGESYNVVHNSTVYFIGPQAELVAVSGAPHDAATIAADYAKIQRRYAATHRTPSA